MPGTRYRRVEPTCGRSQIDNSLAQGNPVVIGSGFASASGIGHFVTLAGMRGEGAAKEYLVCDPNGGKQFWAKQAAIRSARPTRRHRPTP